MSEQTFLSSKDQLESSCFYFDFNLRQHLWHLVPAVLQKLVSKVLSFLEDFSRFSWFVPGGFQWFICISVCFGGSPGSLVQDRDQRGAPNVPAPSELQTEVSGFGFQGTFFQKLLVLTYFDQMKTPKCFTSSPFLMVKRKQYLFVQ